jgi:Co/Zn/Cd efflux system component
VSPELTLALMLSIGLTTFVLSLWTCMKHDSQPQQAVLMVLTGFLGAIVAIMAAIVILARRGLPFLLSSQALT